MSAQVQERVTETHIGQPIILRHVVVVVIIVVVVFVVFSILLLIAIKRREHVAEAGPAVGLENPRVGVRREHHEPTRAAPPPPLAPFNDSFSLSSKQIGERLFCKMRSWRRSRRRVRVRVKESIEGVERETKHCHC